MARAVDFELAMLLAARSAEMTCCGAMLAHLFRTAVVLLCTSVVACSVADPPGGCDGAHISEGSCDCNDLNFPEPPVAECSATVLGAPAICCNGRFEGCECNVFGCTVSEYYCLCSASGGRRDATTCSGEVCCARPGITSACSCHSAVTPTIPVAPCASDEVQVPNCSPETVQCAPKETRVDRCTG
jgi:hypothetical protein